MKNRALLIFIGMMISIITCSQDLLIERSGNIIECKVLEIGIDNIKYKKWDMPEGPDYLILKEKILVIRYENGYSEILNPISDQVRTGSTAQPAIGQNPPKAVASGANKGYNPKYKIGDKVIFFKGWKFLHAEIAGLHTTQPLVQLKVENGDLRMVRENEIFLADPENTCAAEGPGGKYGDEFVYKQGDELFYFDMKTGSLQRGRLNHVHPYRPYGEVTYRDDPKTVNLDEAMKIAPGKVYLNGPKDVTEGKEVVFFHKRFLLGTVLQKPFDGMVTIESSRNESGVTITKKHSVKASTTLWILE